MKEMIIKSSIETIAVFAIPLTGAAVFIARYFWKKEKSFALMKQKIKELSNESSGSHDTHGSLYEKINDLMNRTTALETKMDMIIKHFDIKTTK